MGVHQVKFANGAVYELPLDTQQSHYAESAYQNGRHSRKDGSNRRERKQNDGDPCLICECLNELCADIGMSIKERISTL